jgi:hypothetical protein
LSAVAVSEQCEESTGHLLRDEHEGRFREFDYLRTGHVASLET